MGSKEYDYIVVGSGLFGSVFAHEMHIRGKKCLVIEKRNHLGGNTLNKIINHIFNLWIKKSTY
jgi:UDP-galactopyranose mutase